MHGFGKSDNIEKFDKVAARYFAQLYMEFPYTQKLTPVPELAESFIHYTVTEDTKRDAVNKLIRLKLRQQKGILSDVPFRDAALSWLYQTGYFFGEERVETFTPTISLLDDEGISAANTIDKFQGFEPVTVGRYSYTSYEDARLTPKGFEALRASPLGEISGLSAEGGSLGDVLVREVESTAVDAKQQIISKVIGEVIGYAFKAVTG